MWAVLLALLMATVRLTADLGIPATPQQDVSSQIQSYFNTIPDNTYVILDGGKYRIDKAVYLDSKFGITISAAEHCGQPGFLRLTQGTVPVGWPHGIPYIQYVNLVGCSGITLNKFSIQGPLATRTYDSALELAHGVAIGESCQDLVVRDLTIQGVHGDFIRVGAGSTLAAQPRNVLVDGLIGRIAGRQAIAIIGGDFLTFRNCDVRESARSGVDIEPIQLFSINPNGVVRDVLFEDCTIADFKNFGWGAHLSPVERVTLRRVAVYGGDGFCRYASDDRPGFYTQHKDLTLEDCTYDWNALKAEYTSASPGAGSIWGVLNTVIKRANWRFGANFSGSSKDGTVWPASGSIQDSTFISDGGASPPWCRSASITDAGGNVGLGICT